MSKYLPREGYATDRTRQAWAMFWNAVRQMYCVAKRREIWRQYRMWLYRLSGIGAWSPDLLATVMDDFIGEWLRFRSNGQRLDGAMQMELVQ